MRRTGTWKAGIAFFACVALASGDEPGKPAAQGTSQVIANARGLLARSQARKAVALLEQELAQCGPASRPAVVELLKQSYTDAIAEAKRAGDNRQADEYRDCAAILNRKPKSSGTTPQEPPARVVAPADETPPPAPAPPAESLVQTPRKADEPARSLPVAEPLPKPSADSPAADPEPARPQPPAPEPEPAPAPRPAPSAAGADVPKPFEIGPRVEPPTTDGRVKRISDSSGPAASPQPGDEPADEEEPAPAASPDDALDRADEAFRNNRYEEAGNVYGALYRDGTLPESRFEAWAYCRRFAVVQRINKVPRSRSEWVALREEIQHLQGLATKKSWYDQYLLDYVDECLSGATPRPNGTKVRGASPTEPERTRSRPSAPARTGTPAGSARNKGNELLLLPQETSLRLPDELPPISLRDTGTILR